MLLLGIDKGKTKHHALLITTTDEVLLDAPFDHTLEAIQELIVKACRHAKPAEIAVAIETKHGVLIEILVAEGFVVYPINPKNADHTREAMNASGAKCDRVDARVLVVHLKQFLNKLRPLLHESAAMVQLRSLVQFRQTLVADKVALENRVQGYLENYFPAVDGAFQSFSDTWVIDFLTDHPTPDKAALSSKKMERWFKNKHPQIGQKVREKAALALQAPSLPASPAVTEVESRKVLLTLSSLRKVVAQIQEVEKEITKLFESHDDADIFKSLPGAGKTLAPWLLSNFGENRDQFPDADGAVDFAGMSPVTFASGHSHSVRIRRACCKTFRQAVRLFSDQSIKRRGTWSREYYDKRRAA